MHIEMEKLLHEERILCDSERYYNLVKKKRAEFEETVRSCSIQNTFYISEDIRSIYQLCIKCEIYDL